MLGDRHDLLLVDDETVGVAENVGQRGLKLGVNGDDRFAIVLAVMSSKLSGFIDRSRARMGPPSSWKTPRVSPRASRSNVR